MSLIQSPFQFDGIPDCGLCFATQWRSSPLPKLLFHAEPGALMPAPVVDHLSATLSNLEVRFVGAGTHFLQEDHPHLIGQGLADWLRRI